MNKSLALQTPYGFTDEQLDLLVEASQSTGVQSKGEALMIFTKAAELGIGPANAIPHIHVVNGKSGIDIHIIKAILSRPSSGISWEQIDNYRPMYKYTDGSTIYLEADMTDDLVIVPFLKDNPQIQALKQEGKIAIVKVPSKDAKGNKVYIPYDYISSYKIKRIKRNIKGEWEEKTVFTSFKWSEALTAQLPLNRDGAISTSSNWYKYKPLMMGIRAFTFGARDIASDLLLGTYESSELYEMTNTKYDIDEEGKTTIIKDVK